MTVSSCSPVLDFCGSSAGKKTAVQASTMPAAGGCTCCPRRRSNSPGLAYNSNCRRHPAAATLASAVLRFSRASAIKT
eukprot:10619508-Lingulodinium_polyedra.AAC.1